MLDPEMAWQQNAVCRPEHAAAMTADAKPSDKFLNTLGLVCAGCPVTMECARYALQHNPAGFWAGVWVYHKGTYRQYAIQALKRKAGVA